MKKNNGLQRLQIWKLLNKHVVIQKKSIVKLVIIKLLPFLVTVTTPLLYLWFVNHILVNGNTRFFLPIILGYIILHFVQILGLIAEKNVSNSIQFKMEVCLKRKLLNILSDLPIQDYNKLNIGSLHKTIENDVGLIQRLLNQHILDFYLCIFSILVHVVAMFSLDVYISLIGLIIVPISYLFTNIIAKKVGEISKEKHKEIGGIEELLHSSIQNWKEIKANNLYEAMNNKFHDHRNKQVKLLRSHHFFWWLGRTLMAIEEFFTTKLCMYFVGGILLFSGFIQLPIILAFMNYYESFISLINRNGELIIQYRDDIPALMGILKILNMPQNEKPLISILSNQIHFDHVSFRYFDGEKLVLNDVCLTINPSERVGIVGKSGCGKSTFIKLLTGLYAPTSGKIAIGEFNLQDISFGSIGGKLGIAAQESVMFNLSVLDNLLLAKSSATYQEIVTACTKANIIKDINQLPNGFDTVVGEKGVKLSGGQRQRLSLARLFLQDPDILILDEATSALDNENESAILDYIFNLPEERTCIIVAHKLSTVEKCDRIIVLDKGTIVAEGKHSELIESSEIYKDIFEAQIAFQN